MKKIYLATRKFLRDEEGVTAIEYALIAALIAIAVIVTVTALGSQIKEQFKIICNALKATTTGSTIDCSGG